MKISKDSIVFCLDLCTGWDPTPFVIEGCLILDHLAWESDLEFRFLQCYLYLIENISLSWYNLASQPCLLWAEISWNILEGQAQNLIFLMCLLARFMASGSHGDFLSPELCLGERICFYKIEEILFYNCCPFTSK